MWSTRKRNSVLALRTVMTAAKRKSRSVKQEAEQFQCEEISRHYHRSQWEEWTFD